MTQQPTSPSLSNAPSSPSISTTTHPSTSSSGTNVAPATGYSVAANQSFGSHPAQGSNQYYTSSHGGISATGSRFSANGISTPLTSTTSHRSTIPETTVARLTGSSLTANQSSRSRPVQRSNQYHPQSHGTSTSALGPTSSASTERYNYSSQSATTPSKAALTNQSVATPPSTPPYPASGKGTTGSAQYSRDPTEYSSGSRRYKPSNSTANLPSPNQPHTSPRELSTLDVATPQAHPTPGTLSTTLAKVSQPQLTPLNEDMHSAASSAMSPTNGEDKPPKSSRQNPHGNSTVNGNSQVNGTSQATETTQANEPYTKPILNHESSKRLFVLEDTLATMATNVVHQSQSWLMRSAKFCSKR